MQEDKEHNKDNILELGKLNELRLLLTGLDQKDLERLHKLIHDPQEFAEEISEWLPYSLRKLIERGEIKVEALEPFIIEAMHKSVQKDPHKLSDVLFPVMVPAIRKAVAEDMKKLIASVNTTLESGLSPRSLKWRLQAMFSKRSFAEIVLANTYVYHVRQVFFIHRASGILLHQEIDNEHVELESDMVSGMLTAIRDFVHDSFTGSSTGSLEEIQVGELKILIEQGPYAIVAAIVEGQPPADYRVTLMETVEALHFNHAMDLEKFEGYTEVFTHASRFLRNCLIKQRKEKKSKVPWPLLIMLFVFLAVGSYFTYLHFEQKTRFKHFVEALESIPGYHLTDVKIKGNSININGLCDYQAESYNYLFEKYQLDSTQVNCKLEPYISLENEIVVKRAEKLLLPPLTVSMHYEKGVLFMQGEATDNWIDEAVKNATSIYGVTEINISGLNTNKVEIPDLHWIIPAIEKYSFKFEMNIVSLDDLQKKQFDSLVDAAVHLTDYNNLYGKKMTIYVRSYTSRSGNASANFQVAQRRAEGFVGLLLEAGLHHDLLEAQVLFAEDFDKQVLLRSVSFEVFEKSQ
jgi:hypothetical protein